MESSASNPGFSSNDLRVRYYEGQVRLVLPCCYGHEQGAREEFNDCGQRYTCEESSHPWGNCECYSEAHGRRRK